MVRPFKGTRNIDLKRDWTLIDHSTRCIYKVHTCSYRMITGLGTKLKNQERFNLNNVANDTQNEL